MSTTPFLGVEEISTDLLEVMFPILMCVCGYKFI